MKTFKTTFVAITLLCLLSVALIFSACVPGDDKNPDGTEQPSGAVSGNVQIVEPYSLALTQFYAKDKNPYITDYFDDESKLNLTAKINSSEELVNFCNEKQLQVFGNAKTTDTEPFSKKLNSYDSDFFKDRSIVLVFRFKATPNYYLNCQVDIDGNKMDINLVSANGSISTKERTQIRIFEISKEVAQAVTQIDVQESLSQLDGNVNVKIYEDNNLLRKDDAQTSFVIRSIEELNVFCDEETSPYFKKNTLTMQDVIPPELLTEDKLNDEEFIKFFDDTYNGRNKKIIEVLREYDEEFFNTRSLVLLFRFRASTGYFYSFDDYQINGNDLSIDLVRKLSATSVYYPDAITYCIYITEFDKDTVENISQITVNEIER